MSVYNSEYLFLPSKYVLRCFVLFVSVNRQMSALLLFLVS